MRILLARLHNSKLYLQIKKKYVVSKTIIPIGCDCHPAYVLSSLKIRKYSLPFDWLNVDPIYGIQYVTDNIRTNFNFYLEDLIYNESGNIVSRNYKYAEFLHYKDLITNNRTLLNLKRRCERFMELFRDNYCIFLYNLTSSSLKSKNDLNFFINSVKNFEKLFKEGDELLIYLRYDESFEENKEFCDKLFDKINNISKIKIVRYTRQKNRYGIWGDTKYYKTLLKTLGLKVRISLPDISIIRG